VERASTIGTAGEVTVDDDVSLVELEGGERRDVVAIGRAQVLLVWC